MATERSTAIQLTLRTAALVALVLTVPATAFAQAQPVSQSPVQYRKTTLHDNYNAWLPNGIIVGKHGINKGNLIIASVVTNSIRIVDPDTGRILKNYAGPEWGMLGVDDMCEAPDGTLYHVNADEGPGIGFVKQNGEKGDLAPDVRGWTNACAVSPDGKWLFFTQAIGADAVYLLDLTKPGAKAQKLAGNVGWNNSSDWGADGMVYGGNNLYGYVAKWNPKTGKSEVVFDGMEFVSSAEINDATGLIYTTEFHLGHVSVINPKTKTRRILATIPPFTDNVAVEDVPNPRIFAVSYGYDTLYEIYDNGDPPRVIAKGDGSIPEGIALIKGKGGDRVYIKDRFRLREYHPATRTYKALAHANFEEFVEDRPGAYDPKRPMTWRATTADMVSLPWTRSLHAVGTDKVITAGAIEDKRTPGRVVVFDLKQNKPIRIEKGFKPTTDAIQVGDDIYVANGNVITRVTPQGKRDDVFSSTSPTAFAQSDAGAWISDNAEGKIYQVAEGDNWMKQPRAVVSDLEGPQGISVANDGNLLVIEEKTGRLLKVDLKSGQRAIIADAMQFSFKSQLLLPIAQVAQTSDGAIYVIEPGAGRMSVLQPRN